MKRVFPAAALVVFAGTAYADFTKNQIDIRARRYGTSDPFVDVLNLNTNAQGVNYDVELEVFYYRISGYSFATCIHNIVGSPWSAAKGDSVDLGTFDNPASTYHPDDRVGNGYQGGAGGFINGSQYQVVYHTGTSGTDANRFRIAADSNPVDVIAGGISIHQNTPQNIGTNSVTADGFMGYHFKISLSSLGGTRSVVIDAPHNRINSYRAYDTSTSAVATDIGGPGTGGNLSGVLPTDVATINVSWVPAPPSLVMLGLAGVVASRRRHARR